MAIEGISGDQSRHRHADPGLGVRLRADGLRHGRDHGRAGARRARLGVCDEVRPARSSRSSPAATCRRPHTPTSPDGVMVNSGFLNGMKVAEAKKAIIDWLDRAGRWASARSTTSCATGCSRASATGASRSRWSSASTAAGCRCRRSQLPLTLPEVESYEPTDNGECPLAAMTDWVNTTCPKCGGPAQARDRHDAAVGRLVVVLPALHRPAERRLPRRPGRR